MEFPLWFSGLTTQLSVLEDASLISGLTQWDKDLTSQGTSKCCSQKRKTKTRILPQYIIFPTEIKYFMDYIIIFVSCVLEQTEGKWPDTNFKHLPTSERQKRYQVYCSYHSSHSEVNLAASALLLRSKIYRFFNSIREAMILPPLADWKMGSNSHMPWLNPGF